jgi:hypothetical protein
MCLTRPHYHVPCRCTAPFHDSRRCFLNPKPSPLSSCPRYVSLPLVDNAWPCKKHRAGMDCLGLVLRPPKGSSELSLVVAWTGDGDGGMEKWGYRDLSPEAEEEGEMEVKKGREGKSPSTGCSESSRNGDGGGEEGDLTETNRSSSWNSARSGGGKCVVM